MSPVCACFGPELFCYIGLQTETYGCLQKETCGCLQKETYGCLKKRPAGTTCFLPAEVSGTPNLSAHACILINYWLLIITHLFVAWDDERAAVEHEGGACLLRALQNALHPRNCFGAAMVYGVVRWDCW